MLGMKDFVGLICLDFVGFCLDFVGFLAEGDPKDIVFHFSP